MGCSSRRQEQLVEVKRTSTTTRGQEQVYGTGWEKERGTNWPETVFLC